MGAKLIIKDTEKVKQEKEEELARLNEEIAKKIAELDAKEGQLVSKEF